MNERIRELMRGAIADALMQNDRDGDMDKMYIPLLFAENFAELIVRECADVAAKVGEGYVQMGYVVPHKCSDKIKQHFGVIE